MKRKLIVLSLLFFLWGCQKTEKVPEVMAPPPPAPAPVSEAPPRTPPPSDRPSPGNPHAAGAPSSGAPVPFMQRLAEYKARLDKNPNDIEALVFLANANFDIERFEKAKEFYLRALEIDPNNPHVRTDLASSYRSLGDSDQALKELNEVLKANPNHEVALYNSGVILLNDKNDLKKAVAAWEKLVQLKPEDPLSKELREKIKELKSGPPVPVAKEPTPKGHP